MTVVVAVASLSALVGSNATEFATAVSVIVLCGASVAFTFTTSITAMEFPGARVAAVHVTVPVPPGAGAVQVCAGPAAEKPTLLNVVPAGIVSAISTVVAGSGPWLVTTMM